MVADGTLDAAWPARTIEVLNKADLLGGVARCRCVPGAVAVSAITGEGLEALQAAIDARIAAGMEIADYDIPPQDGARLAWLYQHGEVVERQDDDDGDPRDGAAAAGGSGAVRAAGVAPHARGALVAAGFALVVMVGEGRPPTAYGAEPGKVVGGRPSPTMTWRKRPCRPPRYFSAYALLPAIAEARHVSSRPA